MVNQNISREAGLKATKGVFLGPFEYSLLAKLERSGTRTFNFKQAVHASPNASLPVLRNTLSKLVAKGRIHRIRKGEYLLVPLKEEDNAMQELALVPRYYPEGYVSFLSALKFHNLTSQLPIVIQVVVTKPARRHVFLGTKYEPVRLSKRYYCGYKTLPVAGGPVKMALKEKAILDCLLHPEHCGGMGEACKAVKEAYGTIDWKSVAYFLDKMGNSAIERRLYFCLKVLRKKSPLPEKRFAGFRKLDPSLPGRGKYDAKSGLRINVDLIEEMN